MAAKKVQVDVEWFRLLKQPFSAMIGSEKVNWEKKIWRHQTEIMKKSKTTNKRKTTKRFRFDCGLCDIYRFCCDNKLCR